MLLALGGSFSASLNANMDGVVLSFCFVVGEQRFLRFGEPNEKPPRRLRLRRTFGGGDGESRCAAAAAAVAVSMLANLAWRYLATKAKLKRLMPLGFLHRRSVHLHGYLLLSSWHFIPLA